MENAGLCFIFYYLLIKYPDMEASWVAHYYYLSVLVVLISYYMYYGLYALLNCSMLMIVG